MEYEGSQSLNCSSDHQMVKNPKSSLEVSTLLNDLSLLEQKIHNIQGIICSVVSENSQISPPSNESAIRQQLVTTDLTAVIVDLISTAGNLLSAIKNKFLSSNLLSKQRSISFDSSNNLEIKDVLKDINELMKSYDNGNEDSIFTHIEDRDAKEFEDSVEMDDLLLETYEVLQLEKEEILAPNTHFCNVCGKGFKRDANLRMHMRGHGDEYKTTSALAKPGKDYEPSLIKRYSCPFVGCKRNKDHKAFQPLKTLLCVKNHYKRIHCDKSFICCRCSTKKFSVLADLKTHEKHCGREKWVCSCGTTFSRKDKLFGHVALFQGHAPAVPAEEDHCWGLMEHINKDDRGYLSTLSFEPYDCGVNDELMKPAFDLVDNNSSIIYPSELLSFGLMKGGTSGSS